MAGLTSEGLVIRTQPELQALIEQKLADAFPGINLRIGIAQQLVGVLSEELAIVWEAVQALYSNFYPDGATGIFLDELMALTGSVRRAATHSTVVAALNLNAGITVSKDSLIAVLGNPNARFKLLADVTNSGGVPADVDGDFEAVDTGPISAPSGTLTVIVTPVSGWNSVTNAVDATLGRDTAKDPEARLQRLTELSSAGQDTYGAILAAVSKVDEVLSVQVIGNETSATDGDGRPMKSFETVIWDGAAPTADDDAVAQAIWDSKPAGIQAYGAGESGTATDDAGVDHTVDFTRGAQLRVYVVATVILRVDHGLDWLAQAKQDVSKRGDDYTVGEDAYASQLITALQEDPNVEAVTVLHLGAAPAPVGDQVVTAYNQIVRISTGDIDIVEA